MAEDNHKEGQPVRIEACGQTQPSAPTAGDPRQPARPHRRSRTRGLARRSRLKIILAGADDKLAQIDAAPQRQAATVQLGMPAFPGIIPHSVPADH
jgi:hypothetical protein